MKIAAVTMVYNEPDMLPIWLRHYGGQVGADRCYVIDHGSDDGSTTGIAANVVRIPRSPFDEQVRADFVSDFCSSLLRWYDWVIYTDSDELLVADPARYGSLAENCAGDRPDVVTAFGFNMLHRLHHEVALDLSRPILEQRQWGFAVASMAKPLVARVPTRWTPGFHTSQAPVVFDGLTNFHLAHIDLHMTLRRQAKRRGTEMSMKIADHHHKMSDEDLHQMMDNWSRMPPVTDVTLDADCPHMTEFIGQIFASMPGREHHQYKIEMNIWGNKLLRVPERFVGAF
jgi:hypothetical protein